MPEVKRTTAEVDREARIRGDLIGRHDIEAREVHLGIDPDEWIIVFLRFDGYGREVARTADPKAARAIAYALSIVLKCPVHTEAVDQ